MSLPFLTQQQIAGGAGSAANYKVNPFSSGGFLAGLGSQPSDTSGNSSSSFIPAGMNFGQWINSIPGYGGSPSTPATSTQLGGTAGWNFTPGGTGSGAVFNTGLSTDANTINGIHQTGINDYNALAGAMGLNPMAMSSVNLNGSGSTTGPGGTSQAPSWWSGANAMGGAGGSASVPGSNLGLSGSGGGLSRNPFEGAQAQGITSRTFNDYLNPALQQINSGAAAVGGIGGTRQGVAQGEAIAHGMDYLSGNLANMQSQNWNADQNRALSQYGMDQNFYTAQRGLDQSGASLGANLWNLGVNGAWNPINNANNTYSNYTGFGTSNGTQQTGGGLPGIIGGALGGAQIGKLAGWWG